MPFRFGQDVPAVASVVLAILVSLQDLHAQAPATALPDREFWRLATELSEADGVFAPQLMSNEDSAQFVLPTLERVIQPGGVYIGVGSEQNFTYLATLRPRLAFVLDIRRDNQLQMLMYKALFEMAETRVDFVSRLFSRARPDNVAPASTGRGLFAAFEGLPADPIVFDRTLAEILDRITRVHGGSLSDADRAAITRMLNAFRVAGPFELRGYGDRNPSYAELMAATDPVGREQSYLAAEDRYRVVRALQLENRIVPIVGDFAGEKALRAIGREIAQRGERVNVFYVSNVERYLWQDPGQHRRFHDNVVSLPRDPGSVFIRSLTTDISVRQGIPIPDGPARWRTLLFSIAAYLEGVESGRISTYRDLFIPPQP